jgi:hypothetical protein
LADKDMGYGVLCMGTARALRGPAFGRPGRTR